MANEVAEQKICWHNWTKCIKSTSKWWRWHGAQSAAGRWFIDLGFHWLVAVADGGSSGDYHWPITAPVRLWNWRGNRAVFYSVLVSGTGIFGHFSCAGCHITRASLLALVDRRWFTALETGSYNMGLRTCPWPNQLCCHHQMVSKILLFSFTLCSTSHLLSYPSG